jgi:hypothetical protein
MKLDIIAEIWNMTRDSILSTDRDSIAENMVGILIDNDYSPSDIKSAFRGDYDVMTALKTYVDDSGAIEEDEAEYEEYEEEYEDEDDYNNDWD